MQEYTVGFLFGSFGDEVVLIKKNRPDWQRGKLNGVGGKVEPGEDPAVGMKREFFEETGIQYAEWERFATIEGSSGPTKACRCGAQLCREHEEPWKIYFYKAFDTIAFNAADTLTDELVVKTAVKEIPLLETVAHLKWLVPMALYGKEVYEMKEIN